MKTIQINTPWLIQDIAKELTGKHKIGIATMLLITVFLYIGMILQFIDPTAGILDIGILSVLLFGILSSIAAIYCSFWLQEILWKPFQVFRKQFHQHFNQLTSWQQCIIYFSVFFLLLYAVLWALTVVM